MKVHKISYFISGAGLLLLGAGLFWTKTLSDPQGIMRVLPYIFIGIGCGGFGHGMGDILSVRALKNSPDIARQIEIDRMDERNVAIGNRAKAKAYDMMIFVFGALMVSFALMQVDLKVILLFVIAYLFVVGFGLYYRFKYEKEM